MSSKVETPDGRVTKVASSDFTPKRQRSQYTCMATSLSMALEGCGIVTSEDEVNKVMGAAPMQGASWEQAFAAAQHFGARVTFICPATLAQVKAYTDKGVAVMIAWNPEGRPWSHASVIKDIDDAGNVYIADPNIPDPDETIRIVPKSEFYGKWYEKLESYLVRRPAMAVEREISPDGRQMVASAKKLANGSSPYSGNPGGKPIYPNTIDHGYDEPLAGGTDVMRRVQNQLLHEQGSDDLKRPESPKVASMVKLVGYSVDKMNAKGFAVVATYDVDRGMVAPFLVGETEVEIPYDKLDQFTWPVAVKLTKRVLSKNPNIGVEPEWEFRGMRGKVTGTWNHGNGRLVLSFIASDSGNGDDFWRVAGDTKVAMRRVGSHYYFTILGRGSSDAYDMTKRVEKALKDLGWSNIEVHNEERDSDSDHMASTKVAVGDIPADVERYVKEIKDGNPGYDDAQAWATAWSRYCKYKNPGSDHCKMDTNDYFKNAVDGLTVLAYSDDIGKTILEQMGGTRKLQVMLGVKHFLLLNNGLSFKWPSKDRGGNYVEITLNGSDLYDMEFYVVSGMTKKLVKKFEDVYAEDLMDVFEKQTGWYTRMSSHNDERSGNMDDMNRLRMFAAGLVNDPVMAEPDNSLRKNPMDPLATWEEGEIDLTDDPRDHDSEGSLIPGLEDRLASDEDVMAELELMAEGCPDNLDESECKEWELNSVKYRDVVKDQHKTAGILQYIHPGDRVTITTPQGQEVTGKAVMRGPSGWVLNMGGKHGRPGIATEENVVGVKPAKTPGERKMIYAEDELALMAEGCPDNLGESECSEWEANTEKYKDVVKDQHTAARGVTTHLADPNKNGKAMCGERESIADSELLSKTSSWKFSRIRMTAVGCPDNLNESDCKVWEANTEKYKDVVKDQYKTAEDLVTTSFNNPSFDNGTKSLISSVNVNDFVTFENTSGDLEVGTAIHLADDGWIVDVPGGNRTVVTASNIVGRSNHKYAAVGLYGFNRGVQSSCESSIRKMSRAAAKIAKEAYRKDEDVAPFLAAHAKRGGSLPAKILVEAMKELGPKVASVIKTAEDKSKLIPAERLTKEAARKFGLYGYNQKTASTGLTACMAVREMAGQVTSDLHGRKASDHAHITGFLSNHAKEARCMYSRILSASYPDPDRKTASVKAPETISEWLAWDE